MNSLKSLSAATRSATLMALFAPDGPDLRAERGAGLRVTSDGVADLAWLMQQPQGRRFMARLLEITGTQRSSFTGNSTTFFNEGARSVGLLLLDEIKAVALDEYFAMLKEQSK